MRIRRLDIENFRGIRKLTWIVPDGQTFFTLVGPGDATKSTVLTAIERALSDRWNITFQDTDFHGGDVDSAISIRVALVDLPAELMALDALGACLCGINPDGSLTHDPQEDNEACVVVELLVQADLEPQWRAHRPGDSDPPLIKASLRSRFGVYRVDERVDTHLRWSRMSALGKLTEARHGTKHTLTQANRAAREAVGNNLSDDLTVLAGEIKTEMEQLGSASFQDLKPGLDLSLNGSQGNLALFDRTVPLMNFGLGTRRLAATAVQQLANQGSAILLVDEVEYGLEPHRLVHLLNRLRKPGVYAQAFVTTHSPTALQHLDAADLVMVRSADGDTVVRSLDTPADLQAVIRSSPEAFLSRRIILGEGKTEYGLILAKLTEWDDARNEHEPPSSALGVVGVEGRGSQAPDMAINLLKVGYEVTVLMDSDNPDANKRVPEIESAGGVVVQWLDDLNTEGAICSQLDKAVLTGLIALAIAVQDDPDAAQQSVHAQLEKHGAPKVDAPTDVTSWTGTNLTEARTVVARAAHRCGWFKNVEKGKQLAGFMSTRPEFASGPIADAFDKLRDATYQPRPPDRYRNRRADICRSRGRRRAAAKLVTDDPLTTTAAEFAAALPASVELPAGAGKTHLLAATVRELANRGGRVLVLTHTNAGVHAVRQRLKNLHVPRRFAVATITSFAFTLARPYPHLAAMTIPSVPDWTNSTAYIRAADRVARSSHIRRTISATFTHLIVDEYQDCSRSHHDMISILAEAVPRAGVLGDRMQAIFGFADPLVTWDQVRERFPDHPVPQHHWRWQGHNEPLGRWLLDLRGGIDPGTVLDLSAQLPPGVTFTQVERTRLVPALKKKGNASWSANETVLVISGKKATQTRSTAAHLGGRFTAMEEVGGSYMRDKLAELGTSSPDGYAAWLARTTKDCFCGHADLNKGVLDKLDKRQPVGRLKRAGLENALKAMDSVLEHRTLASLAAAMDTVRSAPALRLRSHEAWFDIQTAIRGAAVSGLGPGALTSELAKTRDRIRHSGRPERRRVVSRTLLVKGLEFDHVIIANVDEIDDQYNL